MKLFKSIASGAIFALSVGSLWADEAAIKKNLAERIPNLPKIEEISKTPMPGLYELRTAGGDILYSDSEGNYLVQGTLWDTRQRRDLTEERIQKLNAVAFDALPLKDAFTIVRGNGKRKLAVFEDPNCGYCKRFERDMQKVTDVTVYMFLYPILGPESTEKSRNIWCAKDRGKVWLDVMVKDQPVPAGNCDASALARNVEFGKKHRITGTPTLIFADGSRVPGAVSAQQVEKLLSEAKAP
ncbi:MAG TPA: DsbC family protein [Polaromonas sp.]|uniref:DsbC family protein n=1 Tax=Polaromonas sp. TaxID=1869339 RepID=UPI002D69FE7D|nr:DsbC family protein [Polaromonas sp.]HYW58596.1 DsbC family protein [Polaromonas sp.]